MSRLGKRQLHELYYFLKLTRRLEEEIARLHREGKVPGPVCLGAGLEAVSVGVAYPLRTGDHLATSLPGVGSLLVRRVEPLEILAHFMGKQAGPTRGRDGSNRLGDLERGVVDPGGHLAAHLSVMAGVALATKLTGHKAVATAVVGERAIATGDFHEGFNFAAVHQLPLVVVIENGPHASSASSMLGSRYVYERTRGYGVPSLYMDGTDILQVIQIMETAFERARSGKGPTLVEARTVRQGSYALREESTPVPFEFRQSAGDAQPEGGDREKLRSDPVALFETFLLDHDLLQPVEQGLILDRIERMLDDRIQLAEQDPSPDSNDLYAGVCRPEAGSGS